MALSVPPPNQPTGRKSIDSVEQSDTLKDSIVQNALLEVKESLKALESEFKDWSESDIIRTLIQETRALIQVTENVIRVTGTPQKSKEELGRLVLEIIAYDRIWSDKSDLYLSPQEGSVSPVEEHLIPEGRNKRLEEILKNTSSYLGTCAGELYKTYFGDSLILKDFSNISWQVVENSIQAAGYWIASTVKAHLLMRLRVVNKDGIPLEDSPTIQSNYHSLNHLLYENRFLPVEVVHKGGGEIIVTELQ